jgi:predicted amidophosphoribosyltransferase
VFSGLVAEVMPRPLVDVLTFIPPDPDRGLWRGQNPAETLARLVALEWALPVAPLLLRTRTAHTQRGLSAQARRNNVKGAFSAATAPAVVAVIDDVYTTGATAGSAATELRRAGARVIHVVSFARAVRR